MRDEIGNRVSLTWRTPDSLNPQPAVLSSPVNKRAQPKKEGIDSEKDYVSVQSLRLLYTGCLWQSIAFLPGLSSQWQEG